MVSYTWIPYFTAAVAFVMAYGIGANDVANAFATSVGAKAITLKTALMIASVMEFSGAFLMGSHVTGTISKGILDAEYFKDAPEAALATAQLDECPGLAVGVRKAGGEKCERCWMYSEELGTDAGHPTLCPRCAAVMKELESREAGE